MNIFQFIKPNNLWIKRDRINEKYSIETVQGDIKTKIDLQLFNVWTDKE